MIFKDINYNKLYEKWYKKLPYILSIVWFCIFGVLAILDILINTGLLSETYRGFFVRLVGSEAYTSAILAVFLWLLLIAIGVLIFIVSAIIIAQKIKVINELEKCKNELTKEN